jgi:hypothetical protein
MHIILEGQVWCEMIVNKDLSAHVFECNIEKGTWDRRGISKSYQNGQLFDTILIKLRAFNFETCCITILKSLSISGRSRSSLSILWHHRGLPISRPSIARGPERWCEDERSEDEHHLSEPLLRGSKKGVPQVALRMKECCQLNDFSNF